MLQFFKHRVAAVLLACSLAPPAHAAGKIDLELSAGTLREVIPAFGRLARISIFVNDPAVWSSRTPALRGRFTISAALRRLLAGTSARASEIQRGSWRVELIRGRPRSSVRLTAKAPDREPEGASTIIVMASKRDVQLRDFPGSVSMVEGRDLGVTGPPDTNAVTSKVASVSSTYLGDGRNKLFIRGIADSSFTGPTQSTVGQYFGDVRLTYNAPDPNLRLYDVSSVEVLEGPQGTLYGAGSLGGIIRVVPNVPDTGQTGGSIEGGVSAVQHGAAGGDVAATVNLPLSEDRVGLRIIGYAVSEGGFIDNPLFRKRNINRTDAYGGRASLRLVPGDGWIVDLTQVIQETKGADSQYANVGAGRLERNSPVAEGFDAAYRMSEAVVSKDWGDLHLKATSGFVDQKLSERFDATPPGAAPQVFAQHNSTRLIVAEARLWKTAEHGIGWVVGGSGLHNSTRLQRALGADGASPPVTGVENRVTEFTLYGEASLAVVRGLTVTAGARLSRDRLSGGAENSVAVITAVQAAARAMITAGRDANAFLPTAAITATPLPDVSLYFRYQEGFRPGGLAVDVGFVRRFQSDHVATEEVGLRLGDLTNRRFEFATSVSHTLWQNIQADFLDNSGLPTTDNIGDGRIWSASARSTWKPSRSLKLDASFVFNDGRVTRPSPSYQALITIISARSPTFISVAQGISRIPNVARMTAQVGFDWRHALGDGIALRLNGSGRFVGRSRLGIGPILGGSQGDYFDSSLAIRMEAGRVGITLSVTNLTDSVGNRFALGTPFTTGRRQITPLRPRTVRIGFDRTF